MYLVSDGSSRPYRCKIKAPGFAHLVRASLSDSNSSAAAARIPPRAPWRGRPAGLQQAEQQQPDRVHRGIAPASRRRLQAWGISRQESWSGLPCPPPGDLPNPEIEPKSPALQADSLPSEPPGKPLRIVLIIKYIVYVYYVNVFTYIYNYF